MADSLCLAVDAMGGDFGPHLTVPAALELLRIHPEARVILFGEQAAVDAATSSLSPRLRKRVEIVHCPQTVAMDEKPSVAVRHKRQSSMWLALEAVKEGRAHACASAGNTGALMAMGLMVLGALPGISRPAICTSIPTRTGRAWLLDMGANVECTAEQLHEFAIMGSLLVESLVGLEDPKVGLLNIGRENIKGHPVVRAAAELLLDDDHLNYAGFVEGDGIFSGEFDIVVTDGFAGNIALKSSEGAAMLIGSMLKESLATQWWTRLGSLLLKPAIKSFQKRIDPAAYNGASLLGLNGVVVKSHGGANSAGLLRAFEVALQEAQQNVPAVIGERLRSYHPQPSGISVN